MEDRPGRWWLSPWAKTCGGTVTVWVWNGSIYVNLEPSPGHGKMTSGNSLSYLTCALDSEADAVDAYGLNVYSWCDETYPGDGKADNFQYSPYKDIREDWLLGSELANFAEVTLA